MRLTKAFAALLLGALVGAPSVVFSQEVPVLSDNVPGSFLVFPKFDIRGTNETQLRIVNTDDDSIDVKLNYVCPGVKHVNEFCATLDTRIAFTPFQTRIIDVRDQHPPCNQGFVVAYTVKPANLLDVDGRSNAIPTPVSYNHMIGSFHLYEGRRHETYNAIAIQSPQREHAVLGNEAGQLSFGGDISSTDYYALPSQLYTDFRAVTTDLVEGSRLALLTLDVLAGMQNPAAVAFINFWNSAEVPFSTSVEFICWTEQQLNAIDLNFFEDNLGTSYGSMEITPVPNCPIPGGCPPMVPFDATMLGALEEFGDGVLAGHTLFHDTYEKSTVYQPR